jgi:hypothetical protein
MTALAHMRDDQAWISVSGVDIKCAFQGRFITNTGVLLPTNIHQLPDFRLSSEQAREDALEGLPPFDTKLPRFDPLQGPFSLDVVASCAWAQSLEFLRDIKTASIGDAKLSSAWVTTWLLHLGTHPEKPTGLFAHGQDSSTKTQRLIWRARRVLNCLSHVLPILPQLTPQFRASFWRALITDIAKLCMPTETLWAHLQQGFDALSPRAMWLRAVAILAVEAAFPGYLREELLEKSLETIYSTLQNDGLMAGGSILGTLSAGADLCMLARIPRIDPSLHKIRTALASLRHKDGTLVTFGSGDPDYRHLVAVVLGPGDWKPSTLFLDSGIARLSVKETVVWMRAQQSTYAHGPVCEVEVGGCALVTSTSSAHSAAGFAAPTQVTQSRCKRRDEPDCSILEATATFNAAGGLFIGSRQIRVAHTGARIDGEDNVRPQTADRSEIVTEICFAIPKTCSWSISKDQNSVLIVTSQQQAWRFRAQGMDICVEMRSYEPAISRASSGGHVIVCKYPLEHQSKDFRAVWQFVTEDLK